MPKTILLLAASPENEARLRVDQEYRDIKAGLERAKNRDQFRLVNQPAARVDDLRRAMLDESPNIVHFCGHGSGREGLVFEDENGQAELVEAEPLARFFANFAGTVECIVLNACYSEVQAKAIAQHIPYVIGMKEEIGDAEAVVFAVAFYDALGAGRSIESAYEIGSNAIQLKDGSQDLIPILKKGPQKGPQRPAGGGSGTVAGRRALLVGTGAYPQAPELPPLLAPSNDVEALGGVLREPEHCGFDDVAILRDAELQTVRKAVEGMFLHAAPDDLLLFYFSGHCRLGPDQQLHLCTKDTELDRLFSTSFGLWELRQLIDGYDVSRVVIILDCCVSAAASTGPTGDFLSVLRTDLGKGRGKYVITASSTVEIDARRSHEKASLFTKYLVEGLETEEAARNGDGIITVDDLYRYAADKAEPMGQHPQSFVFECSLPDLILLRARRTGRSSAGAPLQPLHPDWLQAVRTKFDHGKIIPIVGAGTYAGKVLNHFALSSALASRSGLKSATQESLAANAEYFERFHQGPLGEVERGRAELLDAFREILTEQTKNISPPETHKLIAQMKPPWLVVSTTYDTVLEDWLVGKERDVPLVVVSHILRCRDAANEGKILVVRRGPKPSVQICLADDVPLVAAEDRVIYKILGSPFPDGLSDPELGLDTLVLTETDHIRFLGRLENQYTRVPTCFTLPFKQRAILYLGYSLDIWHYRLVLQLPVFQRVSYAVRQPASQMEEVFWERLGASMIDSDPEEFAKAMLKI